mgnify:CR=1 FL=1
MKFSLHVQTRISDWHFIKDLENLGYDAAWIPDTQMMWSDCYSTMALAAQNTSKIKIGTVKTPYSITILFRNCITRHIKLEFVLEKQN